MPFLNIPTGFGKIKLSISQRGIACIQFPYTKKKKTKLLSEEACIKDNREIKRLISEMKKYFKGVEPEFAVPLDLDSSTPFQKRVYRAARKIPYGEVRTYGWIAGKIGKPMASRAVGQALNKNPIPIIIPCHRVIAKDGDLRGFASGLKWKRRLLELEGVKTRGNRVEGFSG